MGLLCTIPLLLSFSMASLAKCPASYLVFLLSWLTLMSPTFPSILQRSFVPAHMCTLLLSSPSLVHLLVPLFELTSYVAPYFLEFEQIKCQISPMHPVVNRLGPFPSIGLTMHSFPSIHSHAACTCSCRVIPRRQIECHFRPERPSDARIFHHELSNDSLSAALVRNPGRFHGAPKRILHMNKKGPFISSITFKYL